ncbi:alkaline phosphatase family protein [Planctomonas deserti]|uniref:alkaline phosphatase family protein n=1 Tax=Planctomonas deserti TaxID=2144185 RepID=UPI000D34C4E8|nr:nucleotide pyrophosphatase/phosphodiesterase family protein [Planctomonas deserti]
MLPARQSHRLSLADVLPAGLDSLSGRDNALSLPRADSAVVVLVDGLGSAALRSRAGHARALSRRFTRRDVIDSGFPTTTAAAIASLTTGSRPGEHGLVGYSVLDRANDRVVNQLSGWDEGMAPAEWQLRPTVFERAAADGVDAYSVGSPRYRTSGFTQAVLRGSEYRDGRDIADRFAEARAILDGPGRSLIYLYVPELDVAAHAHGWESDRWLAALEELDAALAGFERTLRRGEGLLVTADHGVLDVPATAHVLFDLDPALVEGVRHVAGDPRCLQLHLEPGAGEADRARLLAAWHEAEGSRSWIADREEAIASGWFGGVRDEARDRIGDVIVAARGRIAYYDSRDPNPGPRRMIGQHGSLTPEELLVPLIRLGAYDRG